MGLGGGGFGMTVECQPPHLYCLVAVATAARKHYVWPPPPSPSHPPAPPARTDSWAPVCDTEEQRH